MDEKMHSTMPPREDEQVKTAVRNVLLGSAPERESELASLWSLLDPRFQLTADTNDGERLAIYVTRQEARSDVFSYIEMFYNPIRRHSSADGLSPVEFERRHSVRLATI